MLFNNGFLMPGRRSNILFYMQIYISLTDIIVGKCVYPEDKTVLHLPETPGDVLLSIVNTGRGRYFFLHFPYT